jgi:hypothetical protein
VENLSSDGEELSEDKQEMRTKQFSKVFAKRYPSSELKLFNGSINQALNQSIFNPEQVNLIFFLIKSNNILLASSINSLYSS